jgi:antitoxin (DNA-binding transcriptional repressor) of toxin-antitoxin stability system
MSPNAAGRPGAAQKADVDLALLYRRVSRRERDWSGPRDAGPALTRDDITLSAKALEKYSLRTRSEDTRSSWARNATYMTYIRSMSENPVPLPYEVQEMTTTEARKHLPELVNMAAYGHVTTVLIRDGRRLARIVPEEDAWVYSPAWQEKLREAEADLAAGRVRRFEDDDEFLGHLDAMADEAGG